MSEHNSTMAVTKEPDLSRKSLILASVITSAATSLVILFVFLTLISRQPGFLAKLGISNQQNSQTQNTQVPLTGGDADVVNIVEKANPAVVSIVITKDVPKIEQYYREYDPFGGGFFDDFFGGGFRMRIPEQRQNGTEKQEVGGGSGFFVSFDGFVVTNRHVVDDESAEYTVLTNDGKKFPAKVLAKDPSLDIAVLKVEEKDLPYLQFGNSDQLKSGQTVIAIGNALAEFRNSVSVGVISGLSRSITAGDLFGRSELLEGVIQTDAAINPGNSGGPLLDLNGEVIGVNVAVERGAQNIGFALSSNTIKGIIETVKEKGEIVRPYLGVRYIQVTPELKERNNLLVDYGVLIQRGETRDDLAVVPGSPADKAGIVENDIILEIDGVKLSEERSLASVIRQKQVGQTIKVKLLHRGDEKTVDIKLEQAPNN